MHRKIAGGGHIFKYYYKSLVPLSCFDERLHANINSPLKNAICLDENNPVGFFPEVINTNFVCLEVLFDIFDYFSI